MSSKKAPVCAGCGSGLAPLLCDAEVAPGQTCDARICRGCAQSRPRFPGFRGFICVRGPGGSRNLANDTIDYCPAHHAQPPAEPSGVIVTDDDGGI